MSDLMREEFELWARKKGLDLEYRNFPGVGKFYECPRTLLALEAWQASREALVIELPRIHRDDYSSAYGMNCALRAIDMIEPRIHAAGVKTK